MKALRSYRSRFTKNTEVVRKWYVVDAEDQVLGRLCSQIAHILHGKHKPSYTPNTDCGDYVIVVNCDKIRLTGNKLENKVYTRHTGYPGGQRTTTAKELLDKKPTEVITKSVKGMMPKTILGRAMNKKLFVYAEATHGHAAQKPEILTIK